VGQLLVSWITGQVSQKDYFAAHAELPKSWRAGRRQLRSAQASFTSTRSPFRRISWLARHAGCGHAIETYKELFEPLSLMNEMLKIRPHSSHGR
jgi:hypothetical protein